MRGGGIAPLYQRCVTGRIRVVRREEVGEGEGEGATLSIQGAGWSGDAGGVEFGWR